MDSMRSRNVLLKFIAKHLVNAFAGGVPVGDFLTEVSSGDHPGCPEIVDQTAVRRGAKVRHRGFGAGSRKARPLGSGAELAVETAADQPEAILSTR